MELIIRDSLGGARPKKAGVLSPKARHLHTWTVIFPSQSRLQHKNALHMLSS